MSGQVKITVSTEGLEEVIASFGALPAQIARAEKRAVNKVTRWLAKGALKDIAASVGVAQKILDDRVRRLDHGYNGLAAGLVWFGLNPVAITKRRFGTLTQTPAGAKAGRLSFDGAFVARMPSGHIGAFRRRGRARLPIDHESLPLDSTAHRAMIDAWANRAEARLETVMGQELNYEVNVKGLGK